MIRRAIVAAAVSLGVAADPGARIQGTLFAFESGGSFAKFAFSCTGTPVCTGTYSVFFRYSDQCPALSVFDKIVIDGLALDQPGRIEGTVTYTNFFNSFGVGPPPASCLSVLSTQEVGAPYAGNWDGTTGSFGDGGGGADGGLFTATSSAPVFPLVVSGSVTPAVSNISVQLQPRPQDVGANASVFVFAHAALSNGLCVLAQLDATGRLNAVTGSSLQAATTGVLAAQGSQVSVLNNVPTPSIAGAVFFVGYGASAGAMLANGTYETVVGIPGGSQCTASVVAPPLPDAPGPLSGLWYNATESGWGVYFAQRRNILFAAWYTYEDSGKPKWYVASTCEMPAQSTGTSGTCSGSLYEVSGPAFFGPRFDPALVAARSVGTLQVSFQNAANASMTYNVNGLTRTVPISRQVFQSGSTVPVVDYTDLWFNAAEPGWGLAISHQFGVMFLAWYVYDNAGNPQWYVASNCVVTGSGCSGALYRTTGPPLGPSFDPSRVQAVSAGTVSVTFTDANHGLLTYAVNGTHAIRPITRQTF